MTTLRSWPICGLGGLYIGDDYHDQGIHWPGVYEAHNDFFAELGLSGLEFIGGKCRIRKP